MRRVNPRARLREDRAGDPLDGLVNLFDLGIVLSVAFLLAALSSLDLTSALFADSAKGKAAPGSVVVQPGEKSKPIELQPGAKVVGRGEPVGTVYKLDDGRTIIVQPDGTQSVPGTSGSSTGGGSSSGGSGSSTGGGSSAPSAGSPDTSTTTTPSTTTDEPTLGSP